MTPEAPETRLIVPFRRYLGEHLRVKIRERLGVLLGPRKLSTFRMSRVGMQTAFLLLAAGAVSSSVVRYDQSQTGDYNIHLDLKNVELLAFLDDSSPSFGEYDYDYGELTLKPPATPNNPSSSSEAPLLSSTEKPEDSSEAGVEGDDHQATSTPVPSAKPARRCGAGFYRDPAGRCRRQRRPGGIKLAGLLNQAKNKITG